MTTQVSVGRTVGRWGRAPVTRAVAVAVAVALAAVGAALWPAGPAGSAPTGPTSSAPAGPTVVALGDSYASGEGNPPFLDDAPACHRSAAAWPNLVASGLGGRLVANLACTGATTGSIVVAGQGQPAQAAALGAIRPAPEVVTITVGGNDAGFGQVLTACVLADCDESGAIQASRAAIRSQLPDRLRTVFGAVRAASPQSRLLVVGYPRLFPTAQGQVSGCGWLADQERSGLNDATRDLNLALQAAAVATGATFVDVTGALRGHELCSAQSWVFPIGVGQQPSFWAHPVAPGQAAISRTVLAALRPTAKKPLVLTSLCDSVPGRPLRWRVRNLTSGPVSFTWDVYKGTQRGSGTVDGNADVTFSTDRRSSPTTVRLFVGGSLVDVKAACS